MLTVKDILKATHGRVIYGDTPALSFTGVSIDSRTIQEGNLFVALKGQKFDGHHFLSDALQRGRGAIVSAPPLVPVKGRTIVHVHNTLKALQDIARHLRTRRDITVVGITGTNGKTTTKELTAAILGRRHKVMKNTGNLNNHIGLPLSLTRLSDDDTFAVMEMGASIKGDIKLLCDITLPQYGVITNIGRAHLEGFGNLDTIRDTKLELYDAVSTIVVNADDEFLMEGIKTRAGHKPRVITYGLRTKADVCATDITLEERRSIFTLCLSDGTCSEVVLNVNGRFNIYNALAAAALCSLLGMGIDDIRSGIESFEGVPMRLEIKKLRGAVVISDMYNANPASMEEAIRETVRLRRTRAIVVLGDMLELGAYAEEAHRKLGSWMARLPVDIFIAVGPLMEKAAEEMAACAGPTKPQVMIAADPQGAGKILSDICNEGDTVLIKGSRGMHMEQALEGKHVSDPSSNGPNLSGTVAGVGNAL